MEIKRMENGRWARKIPSRIFLFFLIFILFFGCDQIRRTALPTAQLEEGGHLPSKVAVLPFVNQTPDPDSGRVVRKMFYNFFSSLNYLDMEPSQVDEILARKGLYKKLLAGKPVAPDRLGQFLGVDAVIFGEVTDFGKTYAVLYSETRAGLNARMVRCRDGETIWEVKHQVNLGQGDMPLSLTGLATSMVKSVINYKQADRINAASQLCMQMVNTIPDPERISEPPPKIEVLVHNGADRLILPGQSLKAVLIGEPGRQASWKISPEIDPMPMSEKEPGIYVGAYTVTPDIRLPYGRVVGYLRSKKGAESQWTDVLGTVSLGEPTLLPSLVDKDLTLSAKNSPFYVKEALIVKPGVTLRIEPGTVIWVEKLGLVIQGKIEAKGSMKAPVRFSGLGTSRWKGIFLDQGTEENLFSFCEISNADYGLRAAKSNIRLDHTSFQDNEWGVVIDGGKANVTHCLIRTSEKTGLSAKDGQIKVTNCVISENRSGGVLLKNVTAKIEKNNLFNNGLWQMKVLDAREKFDASHNWWGKQPEKKTLISGDIKIDPVLDEPVTLTLFEQLSR